MWAKDSKFKQRFPMVETFDLMIELLTWFRRETMHAQRPPEDIKVVQERRRARSNPAMTVPVRLRDGDVCRWCGCVVAWTTRKSQHGATYAHLQQAGMPASVDSIVVACRGCTSAYQEGTLTKGLRPAPVTPYFSDETVGWLLSNQWRQPGSYVPVGWVSVSDKSRIAEAFVGSKVASNHFVVDPDHVNRAVGRMVRRAVTLEDMADAGASEPLTSPRARLIAERDAARVELAETQAELRAAEGEITRLRTRLQIHEVRFTRTTFTPADGELSVRGVDGDRVDVDRVELLRENLRGDSGQWVQIVWHDSDGHQQEAAFGPGQKPPSGVLKFLAAHESDAAAGASSGVEGDR